MSELIGLLQNESINLMLARLVLQEMLTSPDQTPKSVRADPNNLNHTL